MSLEWFPVYSKYFTNASSIVVLREFQDPGSNVWYILASTSDSWKVRQKLTAGSAKTWKKVVEISLIS